MPMRHFRGFQTQFEVAGAENDAYYNALPDHDLGALCNFLRRKAPAKAKTSFLERMVLQRPGGTYVDVGANIGLASLLISELAPSAKVIAFEPIPKTFEYLVENIRRNGCEAKISAHRVAVGRQSGSIRFSQEDNSAINHITSEEGGVEVPLTSIDTFFRKGPDIDFLKIDVEGFEDQVLEGARASLFRCRPIVFLEFNRYTIIQHGKQNPNAFMGKLMNILGQLGLVDPASGEVTLLPADPANAVDYITGIAKGDFDVFDLVNCAA